MPAKTVRTLGLASLASLAVAAQALVLESLHYSSSWIVDASPEETRARPTPDFDIGGVRWPVDTYRSSTALHELRDSFAVSCRGRRSVDAALCVSERMSRQFPHGGPEAEYSAPSFDPVDHLRHHAEGAPGHCGARSAILTGELLAEGIPARLVQLFHFDGVYGHNVVEVWDEEQGWVVVDPTYGGMAGTADGPTSMLELLQHPSELEWFPAGHAPHPFEHLSRAEVETVYRSLSPAAVFYPEPWLYLRIGKTTAPWPFRGAYVQAGSRSFILGPAQRLLRHGILATTIAACGLWLVVVVGALRYSQEQQ